jgi:hypothetical protein
MNEIINAIDELCQILKDNVSVDYDIYIKLSDIQYNMNCLRQESEEGK